MQAVLVALSLLSIVISLLSLAVARAASSSARDFRASLPMKRLSDMEAAVAGTESSLASLTTTMRRLSSREGMRDKRERDALNPPPKTKQEARDKYLRGKTHQQVAMMHVDRSTTE